MSLGKWCHRRLDVFLNQSKNGKTTRDHLLWLTRSLQENNERHTFRLTGLCKWDMIASYQTYWWIAVIFEHGQGESIVYERLLGRRLGDQVIYHWVSHVVIEIIELIEYRWNYIDGVRIQIGFWQVHECHKFRFMSFRFDCLLRSPLVGNSGDRYLQDEKIWKIRI